jgi:hypothetical protein
MDKVLLPLECLMAWELMHTEEKEELRARNVRHMMSNYL